MVRQEVCIGVERFGEVWSHPVRQSRSLTDRTGAVWWGDLWFGSLGQVRFHLVRFGWAGSLQRSVKARSAQEGTREIRTGAVRQ